MSGIFIFSTLIISLFVSVGISYGAYKLYHKDIPPSIIGIVLSIIVITIAEKLKKPDNK